MTKEQIIKWLPEITFLAKGGTLWGYSSNGRWFKYKNELAHIDFKLDAKIVMEDQHFEARKGLALGKQIVFKNSEAQWVEVTDNKVMFYSDREYGVKGNFQFKIFRTIRTEERFWEIYNSMRNPNFETTVDNKKTYLYNSNGIVLYKYEHEEPLFRDNEYEYNSKAYICNLFCGIFNE